MATSTKAVNFTVDQTNAMVAQYVSASNKDEAVQALAKQLGKSARSIIAKLAAEKVYVKKVRTTKTGEPVVRKAALVAELAELMKVPEADVEDLANLTRRTLNALIVALQNA
jgi:response regulator RpfG family c-di-GMP phosphodiesterase